MAIRPIEKPSRRHEDHWEILRKLGDGGQGKVHLVVNKTTYGDIVEIARQFATDLYQIRSTHADEMRRLSETIKERARNIIDRQRPENQCALKVLRDPKEAKDPKNAAARIEKEITAMDSINHPNLLRIVDKDAKQKWFVSEYHPGGSLDKRIASYNGDVISSLRAIRPIVDGVAKLHAEEIVHRDIKPHNIFIASDGRLVLGDFGLAFDVSEDQTRLTATQENVGSWEWMPQWAQDQRQDKVTPSFDVYSLGKVIWALVSKVSTLKLWYFKRDEYNVEKMFPGAVGIDLINPLLAKCIVEDEADCLPDASYLLRTIDDSLALIDRRQRIEQLRSNHQQVFLSGSPVAKKLDVERERFSSILSDLLDIHVVILSMLHKPPSSDETNVWLSSQQGSIVAGAYEDLVRFRLAKTASNMGGHLTIPEDYGHLDGMLTEQGKRFVEVMYLE